MSKTPARPAPERAKTRLARRAQFAGLAAAALAGTALANNAAARRAEKRNPPRGAVLEVDGVRLRYVAAGAGSPILLVHGNVVSADDFVTSGVFQALAAAHRVVAVDRPGFGYSARPPGRDWSAAAQADLLMRACTVLGLEQPVVVGHSWGTLVAANMALRYPDRVRALGLLSGYHYPSLRVDSAMVAPAAAPLLGPLLRHTISPIFGRLTLPGMLKVMFAPAPLPERFRSDYSIEMAVRPSQLAATAAEGAMMVAEAARLQARADELALPVLLVAGTGDCIVSCKQTERFAQQLPNAELRLVQGAGHMVHHSAPEEVAAAIGRLAERPWAGLAGAEAEARPDL